MTQFTTVADQVTLASLEFIVMSYGYPEENRNMYRVWTYANNSKGTIFSRLSEGRVGWQDGFRSEGAAQSVKWPSSEAHTKWTHNSDRLGMAIPIAYDEAGIPTKVYKLWHTSPADTGDGFDNITGGTITVGHRGVVRIVMFYEN